MKEINWVDAYTNGEIGFLKAYLLINNYPPLKYIHKFKDKTVDLKKLDLKELQKSYPNAIIQYMTMVVDESKLEENSIEEIEEDEETEEVFAHGKWHSFDIAIYDNDVFYLIDTHSVSILYKDYDPIELFDKLQKYLPFTTVKPKSKEIDLVAYSQGDYYTVTSEIDPIETNIEDNYNDDFLPVYNDIIEFLNQRKSGIAILRGIMGSGNLFSKNVA